MSYARTVLAAIGICMILLLLLSVLLVLVPILRGEGTGIALVRRGVVEFVGASVIVGWISGTIWYLVRR